MNIKKLKPYRYLEKAPIRIEIIVERGLKHKEHLENKEDLEHKEDSQKYFWYGSTKIQTTQKP